MKNDPDHNKLVKIVHTTLAKATALITISLVLAHPANAGSLTSSGAWDDASNWNGGVPTSTTPAYIDSLRSATISTGVAGNAAGLWVGNNSVGSLTIDAGGSLTSGSAFLGNNAGSSGTATVSGSWSTTTLNVGYQGSGALNINSGGYVGVTGGWGALTIGCFGTSIGAVTVTGGTLVASGYAVIGYYSNGSLAINGGLVKDSTMIIGNNGHNGTVTMTSGTWTNFADLFVGNGGYGVVNAQGGAVTCVILHVGATGTGVLNIAGANFSSSYSGATFIGEAAGAKGTINVTSGTLSLVNALALGGSAGATGILSVDGGVATIGSNLRIGQVTSSTGGVSVNSGTVSVGGLITVGNAGMGTMDLTGGTVIEANGSGTVTIGAQAGSSGTLNLGTGSSVGTLNVAAVTGGLGSAALNFNHTGTYSFSPNISGTLTLTKLGSGTTVLTASNTYSGTTAIQAGAIQVNKNQALGSTSVGTFVSDGASLVLNNVNYTAAEGLSICGTGNGNGGALVNSGNSTYAGQITAAANATINAGGGTLTLTGGLIKNGTVLTLTGGGVINVETNGISGASANSDLVVDNVTANLDTANTYNGPTYIRNGGIINANVTNALPTSNGRSAIVMDDTGTGSSALNLGANQSVASLAGAATSKVNMGGKTLTVGAASGSSDFAGVLSNGSLVKDGASTQILSGVNTYTGSTQVNSGTLTVNGSLAGAVTAVNVGATLNGSGSIAGPVTASGSIAGTLSFGSDVTLNSGATLSGASHTVSGLLTVLSGATVSPGTDKGDIGTLTVGSLNLASGALLSMDIGGISAGVSSDEIITTSNNGLTLGGSLTLTISSAYTPGSSDALLLILNEGSGAAMTNFSGVTIATASGTTSYAGTEGTLIDINGKEFKLTYNGGVDSNDVELLAVPEPCTWAMLAGGMALLVIGQRMRRRSI